MERSRTVQFVNWTSPLHGDMLPMRYPKEDQGMTSAAPESSRLKNFGPAPAGRVVDIVTELLPGFAKRADAHDAGDRFVAENYAALKDAGLVETGVPVEL